MVTESETVGRVRSEMAPATEQTIKASHILIEFPVSHQQSHHVFLKRHHLVDRDAPSLLHHPKRRLICQQLFLRFDTCHKIN